MFSGNIGLETSIPSKSLQRDNEVQVICDIVDSPVVLGKPFDLEVIVRNIGMQAIPKGTRVHFTHDPVPFGDEYFDFFIPTHYTLPEDIPLDGKVKFTTTMEPANPVTVPQYIPKFVEVQLVAPEIGEIFCAEPLRYLGVGTWFVNAKRP